MSDLVRNPEDRFSHNEAHLFAAYKPKFAEPKRKVSETENRYLRDDYQSGYRDSRDRDRDRRWGSGAPGGYPYGDRDRDRDRGRSDMINIMRKPVICICDIKGEEQLIRAFVFATQIVQSLFFINPKFPASSHLLQPYSLVCVRPGRKLHRQVTSWCSYM